VLARIVTTADPVIAEKLPTADTPVRAPLGSIACAVHAKGKTALQVGQEIARAASAPLPDRLDDGLLADTDYLLNANLRRLIPTLRVAMRPVGALSRFVAARPQRRPHTENDERPHR